MTVAQNSFYRRKPPANVTTSLHSVQNLVTGAAAGQAVFTGLTDAAEPKGKCWVTFQAQGSQDVYVRFGPDTSSGTTAANGYCLKAGVEESFYLDPIKHAFMDCYSSGAGSLNWYVSSQVGERNLI